jgi:carbonic anhydrase
MKTRLSLLAFLTFTLITCSSYAQDQDVVIPTQDQVLKQLMDGNQRFANGEQRHPHEAVDWRNRLEQGQHPFAVILGCSDSRVPPELVFDQGLGDLFVIRLAGNVVDMDAIASVEYAINHLNTRFIMVLGHSQCGAATATLDHLQTPDGEPAEVVSLLYQIEPAVIGITEDMTREQQISHVIRRNIELGTRRLSRAPDIRSRMLKNEIAILGAYYDIHTGKVELMKK